jgi:GT2 family glycosyltransferase
MKISIIILSFNNFDATTGLCLEFLAADPDFPLWEIIVVDNASDKDTREKLARIVGRYENLSAIYNEQNLGFAAGNNVGIKQATGDHFVLLNSDAFTPPGMINKLVSHLDEDRQLGMVGPVTNFAGNEQCIFTAEGTMAEKIVEGLRYAEFGSSKPLSAYRLDFFCVAIPRHILNTVGLLDENFGRGYFEDLDYSLRVKEAGLKLGVAENCFVYHRGSASFGKMPLEIKQLIKRNKRLIQRKHGRGVLFQHKRDANLLLLTQYVMKEHSGKAPPEYCIANRLALAKSEQPKSWFKRWRYMHNLKCLTKQFTFN